MTRIIQAAQDTGRTQECILARKAISVILRKQGWSFQRIGAGLNYDHATIMHHCKKHDFDYEYYELYTKIYDEAERCKDEITAYYSGISKNERVILLSPEADKRLCELVKSKQMSISKIIEELILKEQQ